MTVHHQYAHIAYRAYRGQVSDLDDDSTDIRVALLDEGHEENIDDHESWADVAADEIDAAENDGYSEDGQLVDNIALLGPDGRVVTFDADDVVWEDSSMAAGYAVLYDDTPSDDADKTILTLIDFEGEETSNEGDFTIQWNEDGIFEVDTDP